MTSFISNLKAVTTIAAKQAFFSFSIKVPNYIIIVVLSGLFGSWKNITIGHYDSSTIRYELS
jgi:hypothetical protein